jgi:hypothetical protein
MCDRSQLAAVASASQRARKCGALRGQNTGCEDDFRKSIDSACLPNREVETPWTRRVGAGSTTPFGIDQKRSVAAW